MKKQAKKSGDEGRPDVAIGRAPETTYITTTRRPVLNDRETYVRQGFANGVSLENLVAGSGLKTVAVLRLCGIEPADHGPLYDRLEAFRQSLIIGR